MIANGFKGTYYFAENTPIAMNPNSKLLFSSLLFICMATTYSLAQSTIKHTSVVIEGEVKSRITLTPSDVDKLPKTNITYNDKSEKEHTYSGVELGLVLKNAGATLDDELKGTNLKKYLLAEASDGYKVVFSLAEIDPAFTARKIILANRKDGSLLPAEEGPFHIIIEGEKKRARSARQVVALKVKLDN